MVTALVAVVLLASPADVRPEEAESTLQSAETVATVGLLTAPHTGKKMCEVPASTPVRFISRASHGPHRYARVEVLEGDCAGMLGYVPWGTLDPEPRHD